MVELSRFCHDEVPGAHMGIVRSFLTGAREEDMDFSVFDREHL